MDLEKLRQQQKDLVTRARALQTAADEASRHLTVDEARDLEDLMAQADDLADRIATEERLREHEEGSRRSYREPTRPRPESRPAGEPQRFRSLGEQMQAVAQASRPGSNRVDPRLIEQRAALGLSEAVPSDGGFFVQQDFSTQLVERIYEVGRIVSRVQRIPLSGNANGIKLNGIDETSRVNGSRWGGVQAYWAAEADSVTATKPKFRQIELNLHKLFATVYATDELLADASALEAITRRIVAQELAFKVDDAILRGTGAGQPLGILEAGAAVSVSKETGQTAATIVPENIVNMVARHEESEKSVWLYNRDILPQLHLMATQVGVGGSNIYMPPGGFSGRPYSTLYGWPMVRVEQASTLGTVGDIMLVDLDQYLLIDKPMQSAMSIHVQFLTDQTVFRFVYRVDGAPAVHSALTPYKGSATVSPFVTLATRA